MTSMNFALTVWVDTEDGSKYVRECPFPKEINLQGEIFFAKSGNYAAIMSDSNQGIYVFRTDMILTSDATLECALILESTLGLISVDFSETHDGLMLVYKDRLIVYSLDTKNGGIDPEKIQTTNLSDFGKEFEEIIQADYYDD